MATKVRVVVDLRDRGFRPAKIHIQESAADVAAGRTRCGISVDNGSWSSGVAYPKQITCGRCRSAMGVA